MPDTVTTTVTFADLAAQYDDELADLRDAYEETVALAREDYGEDAMGRRIPRDMDDDALADLAALQRSAAAYDESGKQIQKRQHALERLADQYDGDAFRIKMLSGAELMDIGTELRMLATQRDVEKDALDDQRQALVVDAAVVDAPEGVPTDDDGDPEPSRAENPLTIALYEAVERLNSTGSVDFRAPGFAESAPAVVEPSARRTSAGDSSSTSAPDAETTPSPGDDS